MNTSTNFTLDLFNAGRALRSRSYFEKAMAIKLGSIPEVKRMLEHHKVACQTILPIILQRAELQAKGLGTEIPNDMISWTMDEMSLDSHLLPFGKQAELQLIAGLAAIHTATLNTTSFLYDLVARPEYFETLQHKVDTVWAEAEGLDRMLMAKLIKLDSFSQGVTTTEPTQSTHIQSRDPNKREGLLSQTA